MRRGSLFHREGPAVANALSPMHFLVEGMLRSVSSRVERVVGPNGLDFGTNALVRYLGD